MNTLTLPSQEELKELFDYNPLTGDITNKQTQQTYKKRKYSTVYFNGVKLLAHRVIWKLMTGLEPVGVIDHDNNDPSDNSWGNLQDIPDRLNVMKDKSLPIYPPHSKVSPRMTKWIVRGKRNEIINYKTFDTEEEATVYAKSFREETLQMKRNRSK